MTRFTILMYHMISKPRSQNEIKYACPPDLFETHINKLKRLGYNFISLESIHKHIELGYELPINPIIITLDDGFEDNYTNAFPILNKLNVPATIFLTAGYIGSKNAWMIERGFPERELLNWNQIHEMARYNFYFGAHTVNHPRLPDLDKKIAYREITDSKIIIEQHLGKSCDYFAYPFGLFSVDNRNQVETASFKLACSTRSGFNNASKDPYALHRIEVYGNDSWWRLKQKITFGTNNSGLFYPASYYTNRLIHRLNF